MKPFFPYYGSKYRIARRYPPPKPGRIIEPMAGSAGYSVYYWSLIPWIKGVMLNDIDPIIIGVWDYLIRSQSSEILALPDVEPGEDIWSLPIPQEAKWLIGFWVNRGSAQPKRTLTAYSARTVEKQMIWGSKARERIAAQKPQIRLWKTRLGSYEDLADEDANWFIDPPYEDKGRYYRHKNLDYAALRKWIESRSGRVIACENPSASWMSFSPLVNAKTTNSFSHEGVWVNPV